MQFAPDRYPVKDFEFIPTGTLGMVASENLISHRYLTPNESRWVFSQKVGK